MVQASAADWALVMLANLRAGLAKISGMNGSPTATADSGPAPPVPDRYKRDPQLVFFQHDEVIVHCPQELADAVVAAASQAANDAARMVFGQTRVVFPLTTAVVTCYGDAK